MAVIVRGVIFDMDGVLVDTAVHHYQAWNRLAQEYGFFISPEDNHLLKGLSRRDSLEQMLLLGKIELREEEKLVAMEKKNHWYLEAVSGVVPEDILPGVTELIAQISRSGCRIAVGSASKNAAQILEATGLGRLMDAIVDGHSTTKTKPDPEVFLLAAQRLGLPPKECVVFEDAASGVEAAIKGGMNVVGVGSPEVLSRADLILPSLDGAEWERILAELS